MFLHITYSKKKLFSFDCRYLKRASKDNKTCFLQALKSIIGEYSARNNRKVDRRNPGYDIGTADAKFSHNIRILPYKNQLIYIAYIGSIHDPSGTYAVIETDTIAFTLKGEVLPQSLAVRIEKIFTGSSLDYTRSFLQTKINELKFQSTYQQWPSAFAVTRSIVESVQKISTYQVIDLAPCDVYEYIDSNRHLLRFGDIINLQYLIAIEVEKLAKNEIVHADLKPNNIVITGDNKTLEAIIIDFGLSKKFGEPTIRTAYTPISNLVAEYRQQPLDQNYDVASLGLTFIDILSYWLHNNYYAIWNQNIAILRQQTDKVYKSPNEDIPADQVKEIETRFANLIERIRDILCKSHNPKDVITSHCDLLLQMIKTNPKHRPTIKYVKDSLEAHLNYNHLKHTKKSVAKLLRNTEQQELNFKYYKAKFLQWMRSRRYFRAYLCAREIIHHSDTMHYGIRLSMEAAISCYLESNHLHMIKIYKNLMQIFLRYKNCDYIRLNHWIAALNSGLILSRHFSDYLEAKDLFEKALKLEPTSLIADQELTRCNYLIKHPDVIERHPEHKLPALVQTQILVYSGDLFD